MVNIFSQLLAMYTIRKMIIQDAFHIYPISSNLRSTFPQPQLKTPGVEKP